MTNNLKNIKMHNPFTNLLVVLFCCISFFGCAEKGTDEKQTSTSSSEEVIVQPLAGTAERECWKSKTQSSGRDLLLSVAGR